MPVHVELREALVAGQLDLTDWVTEGDLAERLHVSRTPIREALRRLEGDGVVEASRRGVRVRVLSQRQLSRTAVALNVLAPQVAAEAARRQAAGLIPPSELGSLDELSDRVSASEVAADSESAVFGLLRFHEQIVAMSADDISGPFCVSLWTRIALTSRQDVTSAYRIDPTRLEIASAHRADVCEAIRAGQARSASAAMLSHIQTTLTPISSQ